MGFPINPFKRAASTKEGKALLENFFSLSFLQAANYILPLITLPYLVRVLGPAKFGLVAFAQAFVQYFVMFTDYGFNFSATRDISVKRDDSRKVSAIFNSVILIKLIFLAVSFFALSAIVVLIPKFRSEWLIYAYAFGIVAGNALFPLWFFQGMERMKYITALNIAAKLIFTAAVFIFIRTESDYVYVPLINSVSFISIGLAGLAIVFHSFKVRFALPGYRDVISQIREGWHLFVSTAAVTLYTTSNIVILGFFADNTIVGYYSAAEKIIDSAKRLLIPWAQSAYPYMSKLASRSAEGALRFIRKISVYVCGGALLLSLAIIMLAGPITGILLGRQYHESVAVLRIISFSPFFVAVTNVLGIQIMLAFNLKREFSRILVCAAAVNVVSAFLLAPHFKEIGIAICMPLTEIFITVSMLAYLAGKKIITGDFILRGEVSEEAMHGLKFKKGAGA